MFQMEVAGLRIQVNNRYPLIEDKCKDYIVDGLAQPDLILEPTESRMQFSIHWKKQYDGEDISLAEAEYDAAPYPIYGLLPKFDAVWLHAAVVEMDGKAFAFSAPAGYGKSTHVRLWKEVFGERVRIINGDNPILRLKNGAVYAYGTPFCGKEGYQVNTGAPLKGIVFLKHSDKNRIKKMDPCLAFARLLRENHAISNDTREDHMRMYAQILGSVRVYTLECNQEPEAATAAWNGLK